MYVDRSWTEGLILVFIISVVIQCIEMCLSIFRNVCIEDPILIVHELLW